MNVAEAAALAAALGAIVGQAGGAGVKALVVRRTRPLASRIELDVKCRGMVIEPSALVVACEVKVVGQSRVYFPRVAYPGQAVALPACWLTVNAFGADNATRLVRAIFPVFESRSWLDGGVGAGAEYLVPISPPQPDDRGYMIEFLVHTSGRNHRGKAVAKSKIPNPWQTSTIEIGSLPTIEPR